MKGQTDASLCFEIDYRCRFGDTIAAHMLGRDMNEMNEERLPPPWSPGFRAGFGIWLGFMFAALAQAVFITFFLPRPALGFGLRLRHYVFDFCGMLGVGLVIGCIVGATISWIERPDWSTQIRRVARAVGFVAFMGIGVVLMSELLGYEVERIALSHFGGRFVAFQFILGMLLLGLSIPTAFVVGWRAAGHRLLQLAACVVALAAVVVNDFILRDDYAGLHGALVLVAISIVAMPLAFGAEKLSRLVRLRVRTVAMGLALGFAAFGFVAVPSATVRAEIFRESGPISAWIFATTIWSMPGDSNAALPREFESSPYFQPREHLAPTGPTIPRLASKKAPVIILLTIDATRADAIERRQNEEFFPTLAKLKSQSAYFAHTTSVGSQTAVALSGLFSGRYFSQLEWQNHGERNLRFLYPATDRTPRFPEILSAHGVKTVSYCSITFLSGEYGVARGFSEETLLVKGRDHAKAEEVVSPMLERLERAGDEPLFLFAHLTEPHAPYDRGGKQGSVTRRYLQEIGVADQYIGKVVNVLRERFPDRGYLFLSSDHGEAFGEHGTTKHAKTVYEELLRVPLFVYGPGIVARRIEEHVTIMDLGPTILDMFGLDTPATFMGQSLVPLLQGRDVRLERPILAESRLRRVLYWGDLKVIEDSRRKTVEVFDLQRDPKELRNLFDVQRNRVMPAVAALRRFFAVHELRRNGYEVPYKP